MSEWTYIKGVIEVSPLGRTQAEKEYVLQTVLEHLPTVSGSERNMQYYTVRKSGTNRFSSHNEFGECVENLDGQTRYLVVVEGDLRDTNIHQCVREFMRWLCRLSKRVQVYDVIVEIQSYENSIVIKNSHDAFGDMWEVPSWSPCNESKEPTWCEYLLWEEGKNTQYPLKLEYKYYNNKENDKEYHRRYNNE